MVKRIVFTLLSVVMVFIGAAQLRAQGTAVVESSDTAEEKVKGFTLYQEFQGSSSSDVKILELVTTVGYNFNQHVGMDLGMPIYLIRPTSTLVTPTSSPRTSTALSNLFLDLRLTFDSSALDYTSTLTGMAPSGSKDHGLSTGRFTFDWENIFEHSFDRLTPFIDTGLANSVQNQHLFGRPYTTLGYFGHFEGGSKLDIWKSLTLSASAYADVPWGKQRVISRIVKVPTKGTTVGSKTNPRKGGFEVVHETVGGAELTRDNGYSASLSASPTKVIDLELGYTRSVPFRLDTWSFGIGFNLTNLFKKRQAPIKTMNP
jgi:hypothetical protein